MDQGHAHGLGKERRSITWRRPCPLGYFFQFYSVVPVLFYVTYHPVDFEILGMTGSAAVTVMNKKRGGAMIIRVRGTRFAIGREFAEGIIVGGEL